MKAFIFALLLFTAIAFSASLPTPPILERPGGSEWSGYNELTIDQEINLKSDTLIRADKMVIKAPLVTNGHSLHIEVKKLVFEKDGKISAFLDRPAPSRTEIPNPIGGVGIGGGKGEDARSGIEGTAGKGQKGFQGARGTTGIQGHEGMQNPGEIVVFAAAIEGLPVVDGKGQQGGKGGKGGKGQKGGPGGSGGNGKADVWPPWAQTKVHGGEGGDGGRGGHGGVGGKGGIGGLPVPIKFYVGFAEEQKLDLSFVQSLPGIGGIGGDQGEQGDSGFAGSGGRGDESGGFFFPKIYAKSGASGKLDDSPAETSAIGALGDNSTALPVLDSRFFNGVEEARYQTSKSWFAYHWARTLQILITDSIRLSLNTQYTREQVALEAQGSQLLSQINAEFAKKVSDNWNKYFINPLKAESERNPSEDLLSALTIGESVVEFLAQKDPAQSLSNLTELQKNVFLMTKTRLNTAMKRCKKYNEIRMKTIDQVFGVTSHFRMPVCESSTAINDFINNPAQTIALSKVLEPMIKSPNEPPEVSLSELPDFSDLVSRFKLVDPKPLNSLSFNFNLLPLAYAENDFNVVIIDNKPFSPQMVRDSMPIRGRTVEENGMLASYLAPPEQTVTMNSIAYYLRTAAVQAGITK